MSDSKPHSEPQPASLMLWVGCEEIREKGNPIFAIEIGLGMTTTTQSYTVFWKGIVLHIIDVMNLIAALTTNGAGIVVAFANSTFKPSIKGYWVWFKGFSSHPIRMIL